MQRRFTRRIRVVPPELQAEIIKKSISLPTFLDPERLPEARDPLFSVQKAHNEDDYWECERHRNNLRRVCKTWDNILRPFQHRYIRMSDIYHGYVAEDALFNAIRINCNGCKSDCWVCCPAGLLRRIPSFASNTTELVTLPVTIITCPNSSDDAVVVDALWSMNNLMPYLSVVLGAVITTSQASEGLKGLITALPLLRYMWINAYTDDFASTPIRSASLTTLVHYHPFKPFALPDEPDCLPALRNLRLLSTPEAVRQNINSLIPLLQSYGRNLYSLQVGGYGRVHRVMPRELWDLCPELLRLDSILSLRHPPPIGHPLHTISVPFPDGEYLQEFTEEFQLWPFTASFLSSPLRCIILQFEWGWEVNIEDQVYEWLWNCSVVCQEKGIWLMDRQGVCVEESKMKSFIPTPQAIKRASSNLSLEQW